MTSNSVFRLTNRALRVNFGGKLKQSSGRSFCLYRWILASVRMLTLSMETSAESKFVTKTPTQKYHGP